MRNVLLSAILSVHVGSSVRRHAEQVEVALGVMIQLLREFMKALQDSERADMRTGTSTKLLTASLKAIRSIPRLQAAERLARGVDDLMLPQGGTAIWQKAVCWPVPSESLGPFQRLEYRPHGWSLSLEDSDSQVAVDSVALHADGPFLGSVPEVKYLCARLSRKIWAVARHSTSGIVLPVDSKTDGRIALIHSQAQA